MGAREELLSLGAKQYREKLIDKGMTEIPVPEFDTVFYCPPALDVKQRSKLSTMLSNMDPKSSAQVIVYCARNDDNQMIFKEIDVDSITKRWDPKIMDRLALQMLDIVLPADESTVDDALKNSKATLKSVTGSGSRTTKKSA